MTKEEKRRKRNQELNNVRVARFREVHGVKKFGADLEGELYNEITEYLKSIGITKKDFIVESYHHLRDKGDF